MRKLLRAIFKRDHILVLLLVIGAIVGATGIPQRFGFGSEQVILALLAVLALDALIERIGYLDRIENEISELKNRIDPQARAKDIIHTRDDMQPFDVWLNETEELWVFGRDLKELLSRYGKRIAEAASQGKKFRFLIVDPSATEVITTISASSYLSSSLERRQASILQGFEILQEMARTYPEAVQVALANWVPTNSYVIADPSKQRGKMSLEGFGYKITSGQRRHMLLTKSSDKDIFEFYMGQCEAMWEDAHKRLPME